MRRRRILRVEDLVSPQSHPLCQARQLRRTLEEIASASMSVALSDLAGWLDAFVMEEDIHSREFAHVLFSLDEAMQPHLRAMVKGAAWQEARGADRQFELGMAQVALASQMRAYEELSGRVRYDHEFEESEGLIVELHARLIRTAANLLKWQAFEYRVAGPQVWRHAARAYVEACAAGHADQHLRLGGGREAPTSVGREFLRLVALGCIGMDRLMPVEVEAADRVVQHVLPSLVLSDKLVQGVLFWLDLAHPCQPRRLVRLPSLQEDVRYFNPGGALRTLGELGSLLQAGGSITALVDGMSAPSRSVVRHLQQEWCSRPPARQYRRYPFSCRLSVMPGQELLAARPGQLEIPFRSSCVVKDISRSGMGIDLPAADMDLYSIGSLVSMRFQEPECCVLGVIRRMRREEDESVTVGVSTLSPRAEVAQVEDGRELISVVKCDPVSHGRGFRLVAPPGALASGRSAYLRTAEGVMKLSVVGLLERGNGYDVVACNPC